MDEPGDILLSNQFPVLEKVFSFLNAKTLCVAASVCVAWKRAMKREMDRRKFWNASLHESFEKNEQKSYIDKLSILPSTLIYLYANDEDKKLSFPTCCTVISALVSGVIGRFECEKISTEYEEGFGVSLLSLKKSACGINCHSFSVTNEDFKAILSKKLSFFQCINANPSHSDNVVLFLMLKLVNKVSVKKLISFIKKEAAGFNVVIIGGQCSIVSHDNKDVRMSGFILYGENIKACLQTYQGESEEELQNVLSELKCKSTVKGYSINTSNSLMLMVSCIGRGYNSYRKTNVECDTINKVFPSLQVFGFFGLGELAYDSTSELTAECHLLYTSVFCLLQFK